MINAGILGASGYAGAELVRLLLNHPEAPRLGLSSVSFTGKTLDEVYPSLYTVAGRKGIGALRLESAEAVLEASDVVFSCLPHGLADAVARGFAHESMASIRGSKTARYFVLRNNLMPAILVEIGFLTNPREASLLREPEYRQKIADTIVRSILRYVHDADM